jgi:hypothetical protein
VDTVSVSLGTFVDRALLDLESPTERGRRVVLTDALTAVSTDTTFTLSDAENVYVTDIIEFGSELLLVSAKSDDATPIFTCSRGYYGTTVAAHALQDVGTVNPAYPRIRVAEAVRRSFPRIEAFGVPLIATTSGNPETGLLYMELPSGCREVLSVTYHGTDGRLRELGGWRAHLDVPVGVSSTGKILNLPLIVEDEDDINITYRSAYRWSTYPTAPTEAATISIMEGGEDLPALYAAAWMIGAREISRQDLDRSEEWGANEMVKNGVSATLLRTKWQEFYRSLDEARRLPIVPVHRPYIRQSRLQ